MGITTQGLIDSTFNMPGDPLPLLAERRWHVKMYINENLQHKAGKRYCRLSNSTYPLEDWGDYKPPKVLDDESFPLAVKQALASYIIDELKYRRQRSNGKRKRRPWNLERFKSVSGIETGRFHHNGKSACLVLAFDPDEFEEAWEDYDKEKKENFCKNWS